MSAIEPSCRAIVSAGFPAGRPTPDEQVALDAARQPRGKRARPSAMLALTISDRPAHVQRFFDEY